MPVVIRLWPLPSSVHSTSTVVSRVARRTLPTRGAGAAARLAGAVTPSASSTRSLSSAVPTVMRRQVGMASNVRTTMPAASRRWIHGRHRLTQVGEQPVRA